MIGAMLYQPAHGKFRVDNPADLLSNLCSRIPATLVTHAVEGFRTSILPMLFDPADGPFGTLRGHLARGNPQWRDIGAGAPALALFNGEEAYISPTWYPEKRRTGKVVPTWNYVTVQVQGNAMIHEDAAWLIPHVRSLVERHEAPRPDPWSVNDTPEGYVDTQVRAIVGLELRIERLEAKRKLTQNRSREDIEGTIAGLSAGSRTEQAVAAAMRPEIEP
jgi:transcriptional regulator